MLHPCEPLSDRFNRFHDTVYHQSLRIARRTPLNEQDAEDVIQESSIRFYGWLADREGRTPGQDPGAHIGLWFTMLTQVRSRAIGRILREADWFPPLPVIRDRDGIEHEGLDHIADPRTATPEACVLEKENEIRRACLLEEAQRMRGGKLIRALRVYARQQDLDSARDQVELVEAYLFHEDPAWEGRRAELTERLADLAESSEGAIYSNTHRVRGWWPGLRKQILHGQN